MNVHNFLYYFPKHIIKDVVIPNEAPDPVNFDEGVLLSDQTDTLGLGQVNGTNLDIEVDADDNIEEVMQEGIAAGDELPIDVA